MAGAAAQAAAGGVTASEGQAAAAIRVGKAVGKAVEEEAEEAAEAEVAVVAAGTN